MKVYKFVKWDVKPAKTDYTLKDFVKNYNKSYSVVYDILQGYIKSGGWCYDFRDELRKFLYKDTYGDWHEVYAPNKTAIRNSISGYISEIVEIKNKFRKEV